MGQFEADFDGDSSSFDGEKCAAADARTVATTSSSHDDDYDTILDIKTDDNFTRKERPEFIRKSFFNKCEGLIENCSTGVLLSFVNHMNRCVDEYLQDNEDAFPNADKVFIDEKTNRPYTAPQRNRGGGGRDSTKRKENAAALGRKAAAKKFN